MDAVSGAECASAYAECVGRDALDAQRHPFKYNPSMRYVVELYPHSNEELGEVRARACAHRTPSLLLYIGQLL